MKSPDDPPGRPGETPQTRADRLARQAREGAALRENLRRRKEQARARTGAAPRAGLGQHTDPLDDLS